MPPVTARAVAAGLADHRRRLAGDRRLVDAGDALDDVAVARDELAGGDDAAGRRARARARRPPRRVPSARPHAARPSRTASCAASSAWALPRPSAIASAKLANSTVNHSHSGDEPGEHVRLRASSARSRRNRSVVRTLPTSTTNMTGLRAMWRGSSFAKLSTDRAERERSPGRTMRASAASWRHGAH